jgi:hypothetical protein
MESRMQTRSLMRRLKLTLREHLPDRLIDLIREINIGSRWWVDLYQFHLSKPGSHTLTGAARSVFLTIQNALDRKWVLFRPETPAPGHAMYKICLHLGYRITSDRTRRFRVGVRWSDTAFAPDDEILSGLAHEHTVANIACQDTSKARVAELFARVFGYTLAVDPRVYQGKCVQKSDANAQHDGRIIQAPTNPEPGYVYQRLIDNEVEAGVVQDMRMPVIGDRMPFVYVKYRPTEVRFKNRNSRVELGQVEELLSPEEVASVKAFCAAMRLDYGEIDVLRNRDDGRIYIVDVNTTPSGPPNQIAPEDGRRAIAHMARVFQDVFLREHSALEPAGLGRR